jgi:hypothetical protein
MQIVLDARRWIALLCLAALVLTVLTPGSSGLLAILAPFWLFFEILTAVPMRREGEPCHAHLSPFFSPLSSRAPPVG